MYKTHKATHGTKYCAESNNPPYRAEVNDNGNIYIA